MLLACWRNTLGHLLIKVSDKKRFELLSMYLTFTLAINKCCDKYLMLQRTFRILNRSVTEEIISETSKYPVSRGRFYSYCLKFCQKCISDNFIIKIFLLHNFELIHAKFSLS